MRRMDKKKKVRRLASLVLVFIMVLSLLPADGLALAVHAEDTDTGHTAEGGYTAAQVQTVTT